MAANDDWLTASLDALSVAAYQTDPEGRIVRYNHRAVALWERAPEPGEMWCGSYKIFHMDGRPMPLDECPMAVTLKSGQEVVDAQAFVETPAGIRKVFRPHPLLLRGVDGEIVGGVNLLEEVTEGWRAVEALKQSEALLQGVFDADVIGLSVFDLDSLVTLRANDHLLRLCGLTRSDFEGGRCCYAATPPEWRHLDDAAVEEAKAHGSFAPFEKEFEWSDGTRVPVRVSSAPMPNRPGHVVVCVEDLRERRRAEDRVRLLQAEVNHLSRLSAMGTMASILAHEMAQPMLAVSNALAAMATMTERGWSLDDPQVKDCLAIATRQAARAGDLFQRTRRFAAPDRDQHRRVDLREALEDAAALALLRCPNVKLQVALAGRARFASGDPVQIEQVFVNLIRNAAEAMDRRGTVRVTAHRADGLIKVAVEDSGPGFSAEGCQGAFEPFRTSKPNGTGLGLSICRAIVEQHGGEVRIDGTAKGGRIVFTLPPAP